MSDDPSALSQFSGTVRLFPLPNLVLFPQVVQPLHIFEPRYRQMTADALDDDRLLAMALLQPGWESGYDGRPAIYPVACVGRIMAEQRLDDGCYNLLLRGLARVRVLHELPGDQLYRSAAVEAVPEAPVADAVESDRLRRLLEEAVRPTFAARPGSLKQLEEVLAGGLELGTL